MCLVMMLITKILSDIYYYDDDVYIALSVVFYLFYIILILTNVSSLICMRYKPANLWEDRHHIWHHTTFPKINLQCCIKLTETSQPNSNSDQVQNSNNSPEIPTIYPEIVTSPEPIAPNFNNDDPLPAYQQVEQNGIKKQSSQFKTSQPRQAYSHPYDNQTATINENGIDKTPTNYDWNGRPEKNKF